MGDGEEGGDVVVGGGFSLAPADLFTALLESVSSSKELRKLFLSWMNDSDNEFSSATEAILARLLKDEW